LVTPGADQEKPADLVLRNGKIVTLHKGLGVVQALAARGDRVMATGSNEQIGRWIGKGTKVIDLDGKLAIPGFIESHGHFVALGRSKMNLELRHAKTWEEIVAQVAAAVKKAPPGQWIVGRGWHQEHWQTKPEPHVHGYPVHARLSAVSPQNPVLLTHASGHMVFANAEAMRLAGVGPATPNPAGGEILKDAQGKPIGAFRETAQDLIHRAHARSLKLRSAAEQARDLHKAIELATEECLANGVTSFQDAGSPFSLIDVFKDLAARGKLRVRLWVMVRASNAQLEQLLGKYFLVGFGNHFLTVRAIKEMIDGALGAHGAWLLEPYDDLPGQRGLNITSLPSLRRTAELAVNHNYQLCVHAIGDRANREVLNVFEETFLKFPVKASRRWRIEHAQHLHPDDIGRFGKLGVIASMQGVHATSDAPYVLKRLGLRRASEGAYVWQSLLQAGAVIANGTDAPVEELSPIQCFYASVTRKLPGGATFFPKQKMTREQALRSYTADAAYAAFEEEIKGTLTSGKLADIVVLSRDILAVPEEEIAGARVVYTIIGGRVVYTSAR
jgi:predicted amidohydrolase YtcJ